MSAIQGLQSSDIRQLLRQYSNSSAASATEKAAVTPSRGDPLNAAIASSGLSTEDQTSLKSELRSAIDQVFSSGTFPPAAEDIQSAVKDVFAKYGLDADVMAERMAPTDGPKASRSGGMPRMAGPPPGGCAGHGASATEDSSSTSDSTEESTSATDNLLEALQQLLDQLSNENSSQQTTEYLMVGLIGFTAEA